MDKAVQEGHFHVFVFEGGSRSSKTYSLIQWFIVYALTERRPTRVVISRKKGTWLNATVWVDFCNILIELGLREGIDYRRNKTLHQIAINNTTFEFIGLDDVQKLHGLTVDIFWINEAMEASKDDFDQLEQRTSRFAVLDYNPSAEQHWIYDTVCTRDDCYFDHSTMLQNPFIPENSRRKILSYEPTEENFAQGTADERKWKIYGLGMRAALEGLIFNNIEIIDHIPESIDKRAYGIDFGYSNDSSACVELGYYGNNLYIDEKFYRTGMLTRDIISELSALQHQRRLPIISESADPRLVAEIKQAGLPIYPVRKFAGSIEAGIDFMRGCKIYLTARSVNAKKEFENYTYAQDRYGNWMNIPVDDWNHCFVGDTMIETINGPKKMIDIHEGDMVLTRNGYRRVTKKWDNGIKEVVEKEFVFDNNVVNVVATENHKFYTEQTWKKYGELTHMDTLCILSSLTEKPTSGIPRANTPTIISTNRVEAKSSEDYTETYMNTISDQSPKGMMCITKILTRLTMMFPICSLLRKGNILKSINFSKSTMRNIPSMLGQLDIPKRIGISEGKLQWQNLQLCLALANGADVSFLPQTHINVFVPKNAIIGGSIERPRIISALSANGAERPFKGTSISSQVVALTNAHAVLQSPIEVREIKRYNARVYDIEVDEEHEFFANGILVHNCIDAARYICLELIIGQNKRPVDLQKAARAIGR